MNTFSVIPPPIFILKCYKYVIMLHIPLMCSVFLIDVLACHHSEDTF